MELFIPDSIFRRAIELLDSGDALGMRECLRQYPDLVHQRVALEGPKYFQNPTLLQFVAGNPIRHDRLPANIVELARLILDAGAKTSLADLNETLGLVSSGCVPRESGVQSELINLLCEYGANPATAVISALVHAEFAAVNELIRRGAPVDLVVAAGLGRTGDAVALLPAADTQSRHAALALASQFGHAAIVRLLLDAGVDPNRYNPPGLHAHSTPLHQAALAGHDEVVRILLQRGASPNLKDSIWHGTPSDWAQHAGRTFTL